MATLLTLRDQLIIDAGVEGDPKFPTPRLNRLINLAQKYVQTELNGLGSKKFEANDNLTLNSTIFAGVSLKRSALLGSDCPNILETPSSVLFVDCNDGSDYGVAYEVDKDRFLEQISNTFLTSTAKQPIFMRLANYIWIAPSAITTAKAYYYKTIANLSSDSDVTEIPAEFEEYIIKKAKLEIDTILGKIQEKELAGSELQRGLQSAYEKFLTKQVEPNRAAQQDVKSKLQ
jgi:hypothetical protein